MPRMKSRLVPSYGGMRKRKKYVAVNRVKLKGKDFSNKAKAKKWLKKDDGYVDTNW